MTPDDKDETKKEPEAAPAPSAPVAPAPQEEAAPPRSSGGGPPFGRGGRGRGRGRGRDRDRGDRDREKEFNEVVVRINRSAKVVKGGRRFSFSALIVVGDRKGRVGYGFGKANEVPPSVEKGIKEATKSLVAVPLLVGTIPHAIVGRFGASRVYMRPAAPGTGVIAGGAVKAVLESAGYTDVLTKVYGSTNPVNLVKAAFDALENLMTREQVERLRGVALS